MFLYGKIAVTSVCLILSTRFVLQALGIEDFGIYNLICSAVVMLGFLNDSMTAATQRFMSYAEGERRFDKSIRIFNSAYVVHIGIAFIISLAFIGLTPLVFGDYLQIPTNRLEAAKTVYFLMIATTAMSVMTVPYNAVLVAHENMLYYSVIGCLEGVLKLFAGILTIYASSDKLIVYGIFVLGIGLLNFFICRIYCHSKYKECKIKFNSYVDGKLIREMFSFAGWQLCYSASSILSIQGMSLILNSFFGTIMNAAQGLARQVCGQMMTLSSTMMNALNPVIIKQAGAKNEDGMVRIVMTGSKLSFFLVVILAIPILFELPYLLNLWLTEVPDYAIIFCRFEVIQQIIASFTVALVTMISGVGDIRDFQLFSALTYVLRLPLIYIVLLFLGIPEYAYWIATIAVIILCIGRVIFAQKKCKLPIKPYIVQVIFPCLMVSGIAVLAIFPVVLLMSPSILRLLLTCFVSTIAFLLSIYFIALQKQEKELVYSFIYKIRNRTK